MKLNVEFQEPDKKKKIKRIIAREGLIILGILAIAIFTGIGAYKFFWKYTAPIVDPSAYFVYPQNTLKGAILNNAVTLYIIYLSYWLIRFLIRFILWAIKTLRERK